MIEQGTERVCSEREERGVGTMANQVVDVRRCGGTGMSRVKLEVQMRDAGGRGTAAQASGTQHDRRT